MPAHGISGDNFSTTFFVAENLEKQLFSILHNVEWLPRSSRSFSQSEVYRRKPLTIEEVIKIVEDVQNHLTRAWFNLMFQQMFENVQNSVLKPKEAIVNCSCNILVLVGKL
jgi:hypothetical protein